MINKFYSWFRNFISIKKEKGLYSSGSWPRNVRSSALSILRSFEGQLLDAGCGEGLLVTELALINQRLTITGIDSSRDRLNQCHLRIQQENLNNVVLIKGDILNMPFVDEQFDFVSCVNTLFNLNSAGDVQAVINEIARVMKRDGKFVFEFRNRANLLVDIKYFFAPIYDKTIKAQNISLRAYSLKDITVMLKNSGMMVERTIPLGIWKNNFAPVIMVVACKC